MRALAFLSRRTRTVVFEWLGRTTRTRTCCLAADGGVRQSWGGSLRAAGHPTGTGVRSCMIIAKRPPRKRELWTGSRLARTRFHTSASRTHHGQRLTHAWPIYSIRRHCDAPASKADCYRAVRVARSPMIPVSLGPHTSFFHRTSDPFGSDLGAKSRMQQLLGSIPGNATVLVFCW